MERLKLAISKARDTAIQDQLEQLRNKAGGGSPMPATAAVNAFTAPKGRSWMLTVPVLLGVAAVAVFWAMRPAPESELADAEPIPTPQVTVATPAQPTESPSPAETSNATLVGAGEPAIATKTSEPEQPSVALNDRVEEAVENWRQAWSKRDMKTYLNAYGEAFRPSDGMSREAWVASRYRNVGGRKSIDVQIKDVQIQPLGEDRARVSFLQDYASGSFRETAQPKTLELVLDADDQWRIVGEWQGDSPPVAGQGES